MGNNNNKDAIMLFLHVPKTGGTTIRNIMKYNTNGKRSDKSVNYFYITDDKSYQDIIPYMNSWLHPTTTTNTNTNTLKQDGDNNHNNNNNNNNATIQTQTQLPQHI